MRGLVANLLLILAVMLGSTHASAVTHARADVAIQVGAVLTHDHHKTNTAAKAHHDDHDAPDGQGDVAHHHHCGAGLSVDAPVIGQGSAPTRAPPVPALVATLASITSAPLTEPPSA